ncbi:MAG: peptide-methionine (S)-S-oxide reductase MsrA [Brevundimonas sp.]|uniref:peptide-methionine (S)-S-oxide reductase MsrA n=1 Tax=Brevundimonas sp. TaxID=1871086 RepID=UPI0018286C66|nr:peptide-methionine (S)-S-oxide reductase MsrA [Brevundimonas sp.]MBA4803258.1 peptide-methionine (S)-S-oxide reductase MsrA [Brevundimonas sp.]
MVRALLSLALVLSLGCSPAPAEPAPPAAVQARAQTAVFAGGCFWSAEKAFEGAPGVLSAVSGFAGGRTARPTYEQVVRGGTGHMEAVQVTWDPAVTSYRALVDRFWRTIDPTDPGGQFCDRGPSYRTAVFPDAGQRPAAEASRAAAARVLGREIVTPVLAPARFWPAGAEHQDFARRHPARYEAYRIGCRRTSRLRAVWGGAAIG